MVQEIGNEAITNHPQQWSQLERMLRQMFFSKNATDHQNILEFGWGKVPDEHKIEHTGKDGAGLVIRVVYDEKSVDGTDDPPPETAR